MRDGGRVKLCALEDISNPGRMPVEKLVCKAKPYFAYRTASTTRIFVAQGADIRYDFMIRCFGLTFPPEGARYAVMPDGSQYHADFNPIFDEDCLDVILTRLEDYYEVTSDDT